jgi:hypothetical protein
MSSNNTFKFSDANGNEESKIVTEGLTLGDLLSDNQQGLIDGTVSAASTTIRPGDHVEIVVKAGKAG